MPTAARTMPTVGCTTRWRADCLAFAMAEPTHQMVIQLPQSAFAHRRSGAVRRRVDRVLAEAHDVDGHDSGSGEVNFFVITDDPAAAWSG